VPSFSRPKAAVAASAATITRAPARATATVRGDSGCRARGGEELPPQPDGEPYASSDLDQQQGQPGTVHDTPPVKGQHARGAPVGGRLAREILQCSSRLFRLIPERKLVFLMAPPLRGRGARKGPSSVF
jgi:hypothetical protein